MDRQTNNSNNRPGRDASYVAELSDLAFAKPLHPEDLQEGDDVAILFSSSQYPSFNWYGLDTSLLPIEKPISVTYLPFGDQEALVVEKICLPFVLCKTFDERHRYLDVRQVQLARLSKVFATADRKARQLDQKAETRDEQSPKKKKRRKKKKKSKPK